MLPPSALPRSLRSLRLFPPARPAAGRLPAGAGHRAAVVVLRIHCGSYEDSVGCHQSERRWLLDGLTPIGVHLPYIKTTERSLSIYSIGAIEDLDNFDYSRLRRNLASVVREGQCKAFVVEHSLRPTASVQCEMTRRSASVEKPPKGRHFHLAGFIMLINVGGAATEEHTAAAAA